MDLSEFEQLKQETIKAGEIPDKYYCDDCGQVKVTGEQSFELEDIFCNMSSSPPSGPILVDVCNCIEG